MGTVKAMTLAFPASLLLLASLLVGCQADEPELPYVSIPACYGNYSAGEGVPAEVVQEAMDSANEFLCVEAFRIVTECPSCNIVNDNGLPGGQWRPTEKEVGLSVTGLDPRLQKVIIMHELLHTLGLQHVAQSESIMAPLVEGFHTFSDLDIIECKNKGFCKCQ